jgi:hypothetical protein
LARLRLAVKENLVDYLAKLDANRSNGPEYAATARARRRRKAASLTKATNRAKLKVKRATKHPGKERQGGATAKTRSEKPKMAKKRRSKAQKAATKKMLAANKARRAGKRPGGKKARKSSGRRATRKAARRARKTTKRKSGKRKSAKRVAAGRKAARTRKARKAERAAARKPSRRKSRKSSRRGKGRSKRKSGKRRGRKIRAAHSIKLPRGKRGAKKRVGIHVKVGKRRRSRGFSVPRKTKRVYVIAAEKRRRRGKRKSRKSSKRRRSYRRSMARENPANGTELFIGLVTGLAGFLSADAVDRLIATHALTGTAVPYTDTPPTTGDYAGLYNATAICAPMNLTRWAAGLGMFALPLVGAHFLNPSEHPNLKAGLQFFGFAAGMRILGKATIDLVAQVVQGSQVGQQLYDGEMRAAILAANGGSSSATGLSNLPSAGLGRPRLGIGAAANGKPCAPCATKKLGAGWPSAPRETTAAATQTTPTAAQPATTTANTTPAASTTTPATTTPAAPPSGNAVQGATGIPRGKFGGQVVRNPNWGYQETE